MKEVFQAFFTYNRRERRGTIALFILMIVLFVVRYYSPYFEPEPWKQDPEFVQQVNAFLATYDSINQAKNVEETSNSIAMFPFNPNQLRASEWQQLGLKPWQIKMIHKYEAKGGSFRSKADVAKIYAIDSLTYARLEPFIVIPDRLRKTRSRKKRNSQAKPNHFTGQSFDTNRYQKKEELIVDINLADSATLVQLRGIGPVYASRIVKYRKSLGNYHSVNQLLEVYGFPEETYTQLQSQLVVTEELCEKLYINRASAKALKRHPYINWNLANALVRFRAKHGNYKTIEAVLQIDLVNESLLRKLAPYLSIEDEPRAKN